MNVTLKEVPSELHERIKEAASRSGRSLNRQIIHALEASFTPQKASKEALATRIQQRRGRLGGFIDSTDIQTAIEEGRA